MQTYDRDREKVYGQVGDCQMAGRLSGADLQRVIDQYESVCRVKQPAP